MLAWYDVDHGSSVNSRPDHGWDPLYQQSPGLVTKGGIFRSATPLLGTYDQIDPVVAKQHLYWELPALMPWWWISPITTRGRLARISNVT